MPQPRLYDEPTVTLTVRMSKRHRALIEYLATTTGVPPATWVRNVLDAEIRRQGYDLHTQPPAKEQTP